MLNGLDAAVMTMSRYCVWCGDHYQGYEELLPLPDRYLQHRRSELAEKLLLQYRIVFSRLYEPDTAAQAVSSLI